MAGVFVRLKIALLRNGIRINRGRGVGMVVAASLAVPFAIGGFLAVALVGRGRADAEVLTLAFAGAWLAWLVLPVIAFGIDETLDPARLALLPLPRRTLMTGLLAASCVGIGPATTAVVLSGALTRAASLLGVLFTACAVLVQLALCVTTARALSTALASLLRSRRARDVSVVVLTLLGATLGLGMQFVSRFMQRVELASLTTLGRALRWFPPGLAGRASSDASRGRWTVALMELAIVCMLVGLLTVVWASRLERALTLDAAGALSRGRSALFVRARRLLPRNAWGAVAAKDLAYFWRDPRQRAQLLVTGVFTTALTLAPFIWPMTSRPAIVLGGAAPALFVALTGVNQFGYDGGAYWTNALGTPDQRVVLVGKNLALATVAIPFTLAPTLFLAAITGGWSYVPAALGLAIAELGVCLGIANVFSVNAPQPLPETVTNPFAMNAGQGFEAGITAIGAFLLAGILQLPAAALVIPAAMFSPTALQIALPLAMGYGWLVWSTGLRRASKRLERTLPEFLARVSPRAAA